MAKYPTKEEILDKIKVTATDHKVVLTILSWKTDLYKGWSKIPTKIKEERIEALILAIWAQETGTILKFKWGNEWHYNPSKKEIQGQRGNPSIISALHELGHAILGRSELLACVFSIKLFQECFPREFGRLTWDGHMLKKLPTKKKAYYKR